MMMAHSQGYVSVMSSFGFGRSGQAGRDASPPSESDGTTVPIFDAGGVSKCTTEIGSEQSSKWICEHRRPAMARMVAFRKVSAGKPVTDCGRGDWRIEADPNRVAFCRDGAGFLAMSMSATAVTATLPTRLPVGSYCNVAQHAFVGAAGTAPASCSGAPVTVAADGLASIALTRRSAVALHIGAKLN